LFLVSVGIVPLEYFLREHGDVTIVDLKGRIIEGESGDAINETLAGCSRGGRKKILLNLSGVKSIDSVGIGEVSQAYITFTSNGGVIKLVNAAPDVREILELTGVTEVIDLHDSEDSAIESFGR
jgi:anti-sigma B factor antagonist